MVLKDVIINLGCDRIYIYTVLFQTVVSDFKDAISAGGRVS